MFFASKDIPFCAAKDLQVLLSDTFEQLLELLLIKTNACRSLSQTQVVSDLLKLCDLTKSFPLSKKDRESLRSHIQRARPTTLRAGVDALSSYRGTLKDKNPDGNVNMSMADAIRSFIDSTDISDALLTLSGEFEGLQRHFGKAQDTIFFVDPPFVQPAEYASSYGDDWFVDDIELAKQQLVFIPSFNDDPGSVPAELWKRPMHLMTAPRGKGKEFDTVILLDAVERIWPSIYAKTERELEAERRLFYVDFTRAKQRVVMLVPTHIGDKETTISPYVQELGLLD